MVLGKGPSRLRAQAQFCLSLHPSSQHGPWPWVGYQQFHCSKPELLPSTFLERQASHFTSLGFRSFYCKMDML